MKNILVFQMILFPVSNNTFTQNPSRQEKTWLLPKVVVLLNAFIWILIFFVILAEHVYCI